MDPSLRESERINSYMHDYVYIYTHIYLSKGKMGMRTHSRYEPYLMIGQLVNGRYWVNQDQIFIVLRQVEEEWILLTKFFFTVLYLD